MAEIAVSRTGPSTFRVAVVERDGQTTHDVEVTPESIARYAPGSDAARLVTAAFEFLLEREPKESILARFDLTVIERYFPEFPEHMAARLSGPV